MELLSSPPLKMSSSDIWFSSEKKPDLSPQLPDNREPHLSLILCSLSDVDIFMIIDPSMEISIELSIVEAHLCRSIVFVSFLLTKRSELPPGNSNLRHPRLHLCPQDSLKVESLLFILQRQSV
jgi:hypothetical protein